MLRRSLVRGVVLLALVITAAFAAPSAYATHDIGTAPAPANARVGADYYGYARFDPNYCAPGRLCAAVYRYEAPVWFRTPFGGWVQRNLRSDSVLYVYPWSYPYRNSTGWHWAYSYNDRIWIAIPTNQISVYRATGPVAL